ncbi:MAG TPA: aminotransferase class I/II-fold pyridoxal phosphate-dependent enzyme [bacterium]|nr:aminotransferase class I/II-fold pyridoxal phosphate-dependent enzyme [bacterium]HOL47587.1 aminotransferase class I/II-fold pyridoxal phosphate-dependent enzyme [bacterium]HPQ18730.1 aminotransferase class I/II-fold pyridoxal phosphate-dependent enzyme [bacterium]
MALKINEIAEELNNILKNEYSQLFEILSDFGKRIYFPKGILHQSAEAQKLAKKYNATIGIANENNKAMSLQSVSKFIPEISVNEYLPYAPAAGKQQLREQWKKLMIEKNPSLSNKKFSLPIVTSGITHGLSITADLFFNKNDIIISPDMMWENYNLMFETKYQATIKTFKFYNSQNRFNLEGFEKIINNIIKKKNKIIILLNFPNNPCGYSLTNQEANELLNIIKKYANAEKEKNFLIILDEAYFGLFYEQDIKKESMFSELMEIGENVFTIKLDAPTKEDYVWGFRLGFITLGLYQPLATDKIYNVFEKKVTGIIRSAISNCSNLSQSILLKAMNEATYKEEKQTKYNILKARYEKVREILSNPKYNEVFEAYNFNSGYFLCLKLNKKIDSEILRTKLLENGVGVIAISKSDIRVTFSSIDINYLEDLFNIIYETATKIKNG